MVAASLLLGPAREHDMMLACATANHRAYNTTSAPTTRDAAASMRPIKAGQSAQYRPNVSGDSCPTG
jgi:hypothetical protein